MIKTKHYEITQKNLLGHEMIGLAVKVIGGSDKSRNGIKGIVVDETQNTFVVKSAAKGAKAKVILPKKECVFEFDLGDEKVLVEGSGIVKRPEDRAKEWKN